MCLPRAVSERQTAHGLFEIFVLSFAHLQCGDKPELTAFAFTTQKAANPRAGFPAGNDCAD